MMKLSLAKHLIPGRMCREKLALGLPWSPSSPFSLAIKLDGELTSGSLNSAHYTGGFVYKNLERTSCRQVNLDGLKLDAAAGGDHALRHY